MESQQLRLLLEDLYFSSDLPASVLEQLAAASRVVRVAAGEILFREGSANRNLYLIQSGRIALEMTVPGRGSVRILTLGSGEMVAWSALIGGGKMTTSALAVEDTELIAADADQLAQVSNCNAEFGYHLMRKMAMALSIRLVATRLQLLDLFESPERGPSLPVQGGKE